MKVEGETKENEGDRDQDGSSKPGRRFGRVPELYPTDQPELGHE